MSLIEQSPIVSLYRPYFDLGTFNGGPLHLYGIEFSYHNLIHQASVNYGIQVIYPSSFRESLVRETGMKEYEVDNPLQLDDGLRTKRWSKLCEYLTQYQELQPTTKLLVIKVLKSLCLHRAILEYVPAMSELEIASGSVSAKLALCRAISNLLLQEYEGKVDRSNLKELENIAKHTPLGTLTRLSAVLQLVVRYAKNFRDLESAEFWRAIATEELQKLQSSLNDFDYKLFTSIYYRAVVFVPLLQRDKDKVIQEMDVCQAYAESLTCVNEEQQKVALENQCIILESRTKEALWLGDLELAEERARKVAQMDSLDPRYRLELGEVLIKCGKIEEAIKMYRSATRLGPPRTAIAWFMAGQCHEKLGELDIACDCYLASIQMDSLAISAVERLNRLAPRLGNSALVNWTNRRLSELREQQKTTANQPKTSYIPEASSELKKAGEAIMI
ncbi:MAG: tetratricopeptide repeat protein [Desmonostoc vinosum HA7617-LM4]|jgi:tetratricopeptide (TPR) repeat protein|nr:tetratricopeptide repeat protein [Desmonostoc vinosum HA7617-LM4]